MYKRYVMLKQLASEGVYVKSIHGPRNTTADSTVVPGASSENSYGNSMSDNSIKSNEMASPCEESDQEIQNSGSLDAASWEKKAKVPKSHKTSVVIIPPEECWEQIQNIRREHDRVFKRWMPHINMLYPFIPHDESNENFKHAAEKLQDELRELKPFKITFPKEAFGYFGQKKYCTLWLKPLDPKAYRLYLDDHEKNKEETEEAASLDTTTKTCALQSLKCHQNVIELQSKFVECFPGYTDQNTKSHSGFQPHLSLGQFSKKEVDTYMNTFQTDWQEIQFEVKEIYLISREDFEDPFHIRFTVPLGGNV